MSFALLLYILFQRKLNLSIGFVILLFAGTIATLYCLYPETFDSIFTDKLDGQNDSGAIHQAAELATNETMQTFSLMNRLFGIGFGYFYGNVFNNILINAGWIGLAIYIYAFLKPVLFLRSDQEVLRLKVSVAAMFFLFYINVSELFFPRPGCFWAWPIGGLISSARKGERPPPLDLQTTAWRWPTH